MNLFKAVAAPLSDTFILSYNLIPTPWLIYLPKTIYRDIPPSYDISDLLAGTFIFLYNSIPAQRLICMQNNFPSDYPV